MEPAPRQAREPIIPVTIAALVLLFLAICCIGEVVIVVLMPHNRPSELNLLSYMAADYRPWAVALAMPPIPQAAVDTQVAERATQLATTPTPFSLADIPTEIIPIVDVANAPTLTPPTADGMVQPTVTPRRPQLGPSPTLRIVTVEPHPTREALSTMTPRSLTSTPTLSRPSPTSTARATPTVAPIPTATRLPPTMRPTPTSVSATAPPAPPTASAPPPAPTPAPTNTAIVVSPTQEPPPVPTHTARPPTPQPPTPLPTFTSTPSAPPPTMTPTAPATLPPTPIATITAIPATPVPTATPSVTPTATLTMTPTETPTSTSTPTDPPTPTPSGPLVPELTCVVLNADGSSTAFFGYTNPSASIITVPIGTENLFVPAPADRGQPSDFAPGTFTNVFSVTFNGAITWRLQGRNVTAPGSPPRPCP